MSWRQHWNLHAPNCQHGRAGLAALEALEQRRREVKLNFSVDWQNRIDNLLSQELMKQHQLMVSCIFEIARGR